MLANPLLPHDAPDPFVVRHEGYYYMTATFAAGADRLVVWRSPTLGGFGGPSVERAVVWRTPQHGPQSRDVWAPELHRVEGQWYLHYCASDGVDAHHRQFVLEAETDDPLGPWADRGRVDPALDEYAIDGSVLQMPDGRCWFMWSNGKIWIAPMESPVRVATDGPRVCIARADRRWERDWLEGPQALLHGDDVFVAYSAGHSGTPEYRVGALQLKGRDPLRARSWHKLRRPLLEPDPARGVWTTGHCSFTTSPDGSEDWIVYHAKATSTGGFEGRTARAQRFSWSRSGAPVVGPPVPLGVELDPPSGD